ncbi:NAD-glutamate dehydrogenase [Kitasatospora aureofaciens]|nr:NAD-glutamate dehydrogenase [Kitasatospora aureofaciens]UKZ06361.1 NAD-glutamate dehydrogenase [Streptomyces viridifaciens]HJD85607.1 NAD-glutamate dehydrogenase [Kitasatospora aureofaciens]
MPLSFALDSALDVIIPDAPLPRPLQGSDRGSGQKP